MFWVHGLGELGARNLAPGVLVSARYRINGARADVDGSEDVVTVQVIMAELSIQLLSHPLQRIGKSPFHLLRPRYFQAFFLFLRAASFP